ncbi:MAG: ABC transporter ATP-binding protein [Anaerolineae bacterium]
MQDFNTIYRLKPLLKEYLWTFASVIGSGLLGSLFESVGIALFIPFLYSLEAGAFELESETWLVDVLNGWTETIPTENRVAIIVSAIFALIILKSGVTFLHEYLSSKGYAEIACRLRQLTFDKVMRIRMSVVDQRGSGKLVNTLNNQTWATADAIFSFAGLLFHGFSIIILTGLLFLISWQLTLFVILVAAIISMMTRLITNQIAGLSQQGVLLEDALTGRILRGVQGLRIVRMFNQQKYEQTEFESTSEGIKKVYFKVDILGSLIQPMSEILAMVFVAAALIWLLRDPSQLPLVITLIVVIYRLHPQVIAWDQARTEILAASGAINAVMDLIDEDEVYDLSAGTSTYTSIKHAIEFSNLSFQYESSEGETATVLDNVSLKIAKNKTTAIVGPSGSGKTTLINLLLRFYDPTQGAILVDGQPLNTLSLTAWRKNMAVVSQDVQLFNISIADNIMYGKFEATKEQIVAAAKQADAHEFIIDLPNGYDTIVGDRGARLSGGQKQRISFARAILRDPQILILDEATNALDSISESQIYKFIAALGRERTVVIISHNLSTIENADQIYVLDSGEIVESGSKSDLILNQGLFSQLYKLQNGQPNEFHGMGRFEPKI